MYILWGRRNIFEFHVSGDLWEKCLWQLMLVFYLLSQNNCKRNAKVSLDVCKRICKNLALITPAEEVFFFLSVYLFFFFFRAVEILAVILMLYYVSVFRKSGRKLDRNDRKICYYCARAGESKFCYWAIFAYFITGLSQVKFSGEIFLVERVSVS